VTAWRDVGEAEPEFAQGVQAQFGAGRHKTIATLRADWSPRISGIEAAFGDGELVFGSMVNARMGADLRRVPRFALDSATVDPVEGAEAQWPGEAKISGRGDRGRACDRTSRWRRFHADIAGVVHPPHPVGHEARRRVVDTRARIAKDRSTFVVALAPATRNMVGSDQCRPPALSRGQ
jgi:hypothetical protein